MNSELHGNKVQISYDGNTTLGKFEVPPTITLEYANFGSYSYSDVGIPTRDGGAFEFDLKRLAKGVFNVKYLDKALSLSPRALEILQEVNWLSDNR